ncbi:TRAP transporter small permease subunit [Pontitalea aquivivens]|uniref:TRAP transporter small permease subunit n=1 Tax=Pontitalea aquivivens TaxID=3388663 RepID=UPI003970551F
MKKLIEKTAILTVALGSIGLLLAMFVGVGDVVGTLFNKPIPGALELTESTMVLIVFGGLTFAQIRRGHIRVELFYLRAGPRVRSTMDIIAALSGIVFFGLLSWQAVNEAMYSWQIKEASFGLTRFPLYPARTLLAFGSILMLLQLAVDLWEDIRGFGNPRHFEIG